jgi:hypothetical protein
MSISQATNELAAAFDSGDDARIDAALDNHPRTASALERIHRDAVCGGRDLSADTLRQERMNTFRRAYRDEDDDAGALYEYRERVPQHDGD